MCCRTSVSSLSDSLPFATAAFIPASFSLQGSDEEISWRGVFHIWSTWVLKLAVDAGCLAVLRELNTEVRGELSQGASHGAIHLSLPTD